MRSAFICNEGIIDLILMSKNMHSTQNTVSDRLKFLIPCSYCMYFSNKQ